MTPHFVALPLLLVSSKGSLLASVPKRLEQCRCQGDSMRIRLGHPRSKSPPRPCRKLFGQGPQSQGGGTNNPNLRFFIMNLKVTGEQHTVLQPWEEQSKGMHAASRLVIDYTLPRVTACAQQTFDLLVCCRWASRSTCFGMIHPVPRALGCRHAFRSP